MTIVYVLNEVNQCWTGSCGSVRMYCGPVRWCGGSVGVVLAQLGGVVVQMVWWLSKRCGGLFGWCRVSVGGVLAQLGGVVVQMVRWLSWRCGGLGRWCSASFRGVVAQLEV